MNARITAQRPARRPRRKAHGGFAWDDLHTVLAVARQGSLSAAAQLLGVNHSTVSRRIAALEKAAGHPLFRGQPRGQRPTAAGEELIRAAERMEAEILRLGRLLASPEVGLEGSVRLTAPSDIANALLPGPLARFRALHPGITVELVDDNRMLDLARREADIALRATNDDPPGFLVGRRVTHLAVAAYAGRAYLERTGQETIAAGALADQEWIGWDAPLRTGGFRRWVQEHLPPEAFVYRSGSLENHRAAAEAGLGLALLPCFLGDPTPGLVRVLPPQPALATPLWLISHPNLKDTPRIAAMKDFLHTELKVREALLSGDGGS